MSAQVEFTWHSYVPGIENSKRVKTYRFRFWARWTVFSMSFYPLSSRLGFVSARLLGDQS